MSFQVTPLKILSTPERTIHSSESAEFGHVVTHIDGKHLLLAASPAQHDPESTPQLLVVLPFAKRQGLETAFIAAVYGAMGAVELKMVWHIRNLKV